MKNKYQKTSNETKKELNVSDCKLMHLREDGTLRAIKKGRAYLYNIDDVEHYKSNKGKT